MPRVRVALDAMGGDHAPDELVRGACLALERQADLEVLLVGPGQRLEALITASAPSAEARARLSVCEATQALDMDEAASALRRKKDASVSVAMRAVREGRAEAVVAAGSTGGAMAAALLTLGRIRGIERPAIAVVLPTRPAPTVLLDVGANVDVRPPLLVQFARMGSAYARTVLGISSPTVGLLNIGEEAGKGDGRSTEAFPLLATAPDLRFVGNVEARALPRGVANVVVCDGFVGNVVLKLAEGMTDWLTDLVREGIRSRGLLAGLGAWLLRPVFRGVKAELDPARHGGALLLGVRGVCVIAHGSSRAPAIASAIEVARRAVQEGILPRLEETFQTLAAATPGPDAEPTAGTRHTSPIHPDTPTQETSS
ncbi:MAG: phosphate acyltransferase PlsX [bacterium]|nr:phosphate acyltransferase PlsX [bacterium]